MATDGRTDGAGLHRLFFPSREREEERARDFPTPLSQAARIAGLDRPSVDRRPPNSLLASHASLSLSFSVDREEGRGGKGLHGIIDAELMADRQRDPTRGATGSRIEREREH